MIPVSVEAIKSLVQGFAFAIHSRNRHRAHIFDALVLKRYEALRQVHSEFHASLLPIRDALIRLEFELREGGCGNYSHTLELLESLREKDLRRHMGQPERRELYASCLAIERCGPQFTGGRQPLTQSERELVTQFMGAVCRYFQTEGEYRHAYGSTVGALLRIVELWVSSNAVNPAEVHDVISRLERELAKLADKWALAVAAFAKLEMSLQLNLKLDVSAEMSKLPAPAIDRAA